MKVKLSLEMDINDADSINEAGFTRSQIVANQLKQIIWQAVEGGVCWSPNEQVGFCFSPDVLASIGSCGVVMVEREPASCQHKFKPLTAAQKNQPYLSIDAECIKCGKMFGWRCKESPDGVCHYYTKNGMVTLLDGTEVKPPEHDIQYETDDSCLWCGMPDERK